MARRVKQSHYEEQPPKPGSRLSPPAPPPGRDPHLGKQAFRFIAERWVGELVSSDRTGQVVLKAKGKREITLERLIQILSGHEGFQVELTVFEDADPDVAWRIGEAVRGFDEDSDIRRAPKRRDNHDRQVGARAAYAALHAGESSLGHLGPDGQKARP